MYAYDSAEAFGSWCVKGAGGREDTSFADRERAVMRHWLMSGWTEPEFLIALHQRNNPDPRWQRIIQQAYEIRRRHGRGSSGWREV